MNFYFEFQNKTEGLDIQYMHKNFYNPGFEDKTFAGTDASDTNSAIMYTYLILLSDEAKRNRFPYLKIATTPINRLLQLA